MLAGLDERMQGNAITVGIGVTLHIGFQVLAQAAVTAAMFAHLRGQRVSLGALLGMTLRPAPLLWFAAAYGFVSGLVVLVQYSVGYQLDYWIHYWMDLGYEALLYLFVAVAVPVLVHEGTGVLEALKRNVSLTGQARGRLLGIYALIALIGALANIPLPYWVGASEDYMERLMLWWLANKVIGAVIWGAVNASIYRALRLVREGVDITSTPSVPDARIHTPA